MINYIYYYNIMNMMNLKADILYFIHVMIVLLSIIVPFILPLKYIKYHIFYVVVLILHWIIFDGCILSIMEKKYRNEEYPKNYKNNFFDKALNQFLFLDLNEIQLKYLSTFLLILPIIVYAYRLKYKIEHIIVINMILYYIALQKLM